MTELHDTVARMQKGVRDFEAMRLACIEMDREREELLKQVGELNIAVDLIREARDE